MQSLCQHYLAAPAQETALIQQIHIVAAHAICGLVEGQSCFLKTIDLPLLVSSSAPLAFPLVPFP